MFFKRFGTFSLLAAMAMAPAGQSAADTVGDIVNGAVRDALKEEIRERVVTPAADTVVRRVTRNQPQPQRALNRETQTSLNYFGFRAGTPDGALGRRSRAAISEYQSHMGFSRTGYLTEYEREFLVSSYYRAVAGDQTSPGLTPLDPYRARDLLYTYRDQPDGSSAEYTPYPDNTGSNYPAGNDTFATGFASSSGLPTFMADEGPQTSLSSRCNQVSLMTNANGGFVTQANMSDPRFALNEQFCLARTYAIALGEELASEVQGVSRARLESECASFGPTMQDYVTALSLKPRDEVFQNVSGFVLSTGMSPAQLNGTAKVCLSVGYRTDNLDVALGSALLLAVLGDAAYNELLGHHLMQGYGTSQRPDLALAWYQASFDAISNGAPAMFAPGDIDRNYLIRKAALQLNSGDQAANSQAGGPNQSNPGLPTFSVGSGGGN